jgi:hypothetical protein
MTPKRLIQHLHAAIDGSIITMNLNQSLSPKAPALQAFSNFCALFLSNTGRTISVMKSYEQNRRDKNEK